jgi:hypothetical protein
LRQQLAAIKRRHPRSQLGRLDKLFWVVIRQFWSQWKKALIVVTPETVVRWHQAGFRLYCRLISKVKEADREKTDAEAGAAVDLPDGCREHNLGSTSPPHGELLMLGFDISERTICRWMKQAPRDSEPAKRWRAFLKNHREAIAAMDFFTVPTITFGVLYCFFVIGHDRRRILHVNVTKHPTSGWIMPQLREAFPFEASHKYLIFDRDQKFGFEVLAAESHQDHSQANFIPKSMAEWHRGAVGGKLYHIVALNERHLKRLLSEYVRYHHEDRTHLGLEKGTPDGRIRSVASGGVLSRVRLGGLHHRYVRAT